MDYIEEIKKRLKEPFWIGLILILIISLFMNYQYTSSLQSLPSPIYGGDYYYQLGAVNHVKYGGNPLESSTVKGELPAYLPLYSFIVGNFAKILNLDSIKAILIISYLIITLSAAIIYFFIYKLFNNYYISFITAFYLITHNTLPIIKYSFFGKFLIIPLFIYLFYNFLNDDSIKNSVLLGLIYGLAGLTHAMIFIPLSFILLFAFFYHVVLKNIEFKKKKIGIDIIKKRIFSYSIILIVGVPIALLWWFHPIFTFHGKTSAFYAKAQFPILTLSYQFSFLMSFIKNYFINFSRLSFSIFNILALVGLFSIKSKDKYIKRTISFLKFLFLSFLIILFHYFITENFFNFSFSSGHILSLFNILFIFLFALGIFIGSSLLKNPKHKQILYVVIIALIMFSSLSFYKGRMSDRWYNVGKNPLPQHLVGLSDYLIENGDVDDVVLTTKEIGFAVNALSGRKLVSYRRGHAVQFQFIESDERELDQAIILYGNNTDLKKKLIEKYDIKYLYWDTYWIQSEFFFSQDGQITGWYDPLMIFYSEENEKKLIENGVKYFVETTWLDPAIRGENFRKFKIIFISPENYVNITTPWKPDINTLVKEVWIYDFGNQRIASLYEFI